MSYSLETYSLAIMVAMAANRVIGQNNRIPWRLPGDLKRVKQLTMGKALLMGRKTHESIGRALPGRLNIVLTRQIDYQAEGCVVVHTIEEGLAAAHTYAPTQEVIVFGGADLYQELLPHTRRLYLTLLDEPFEGDTLFPLIQWDEWQEQHRERFEFSPDNPHPYTFMILERC